MNDFLGGLAVNNSPHPRAAKPSHHNHWAHVPQAESLCAATKTQADKVNKEKLYKRDSRGEMYHFREQSWNLRQEKMVTRTGSTKHKALSNSEIVSLLHSFIKATEGHRNHMQIKNQRYSFPLQALTWHGHTLFNAIQFWTDDAFTSLLILCFYMWSTGFTVITGRWKLTRVRYTCPFLKSVVFLALSFT